MFTNQTEPVEDLCPKCRTNRPYTLRKKEIQKKINGKNFHFQISAAYCSVCGAEMSPPGLIDYNIKEVEGQYQLMTTDPFS